MTETPEAPDTSGTPQPPLAEENVLTEQVGLAEGGEKGEGVPINTLLSLARRIEADRYRATRATRDLARNEGVSFIPSDQDLVSDEACLMEVVRVLQTNQSDAEDTVRTKYHLTQETIRAICNAYGIQLAEKKDPAGQDTGKPESSEKTILMPESVGMTPPTQTELISKTLTVEVGEIPDDLEPLETPFVMNGFVAGYYNYSLSTHRQNNGELKVSILNLDEDQEKENKRSVYITLSRDEGAGNDEYLLGELLVYDGDENVRELRVQDPKTEYVIYGKIHLYRSGDTNETSIYRADYSLQVCKSKEQVQVAPQPTPVASPTSEADVSRESLNRVGLFDSHKCELPLEQEWKNRIETPKHGNIQWGINPTGDPMSPRLWVWHESYGGEAGDTILSPGQTVHCDHGQFRAEGQIVGQEGKRTAVITLIFTEVERLRETANTSRNIVDAISAAGSAPQSASAGPGSEAAERTPPPVQPSEPAPVAAEPAPAPEPPAEPTVPGDRHRREPDPERRISPPKIELGARPPDLEPLEPQVIIKNTEGRGRNDDDQFTPYEKFNIRVASTQEKNQVYIQLLPTKGKMIEGLIADFIAETGQKELRFETPDSNYVIWGKAELYHESDGTPKVVYAFEVCKKRAHTQLPATPTAQASIGRGGAETDTFKNDLSNDFPPDGLETIYPPRTRLLNRGISRNPGLSLMYDLIPDKIRVVFDPKSQKLSLLNYDGNRYGEYASVGTLQRSLGNGELMVEGALEIPNSTQGLRFRVKYREVPDNIVSKQYNFAYVFEQSNKISLKTALGNECPTGVHEALSASGYDAKAMLELPYLEFVYALKTQEPEDNGSKGRITRGFDRVRAIVRKPDIPSLDEYNHLRNRVRKQFGMAELTLDTTYGNIGSEWYNRLISSIQKGHVIEASDIAYAAKDRDSKIAALTALVQCGKYDIVDSFLHLPDHEQAEAGIIALAAFFYHGPVARCAVNKDGKYPSWRARRFASAVLKKADVTYDKQTGSII